MGPLLCPGHCDRLWGHRKRHLPSGSLKVPREWGRGDQAALEEQGTGEHPRPWDGQSVGRLLGGGSSPDAEGQQQQESKGWEAAGLEVAGWGGGGGASGQHLLPGARQQG